MLAACGQQAIAEALPSTNSVTPETVLAHADTQNGWRLTDAVLRYSLDAGSRLSRRRKKMRDRFQRLMRNARQALHIPAPDLLDNETTELIRLLKKEEIGCGVLVGAAQDSWLSEAFMGAMTGHLLMPNVVCLGRPTPQFTKFHRRYADESGVEFRYLSAGGKAILRNEEASGLIVIEEPELLDDVVRTCAAARLVVVQKIGTAAGRDCFHALTADETHDLVLHEPAPSRDYAVFRRAEAAPCTTVAPLRLAA